MGSGLQGAPFPPPRAHVDPDGSSLEPELRAQAILEIPLIREMEGRCDVGKKDEGRRPHPRWRRKENADMPLPRARGRMLSRNTLDELIELGRLDPPLPRLCDLVDRFEQLRRPL